MAWPFSYFSSTATTIDEMELHAALATHAGVREVQTGSYVDVVAVLIALAHVESALKLQALGDYVGETPHAFGLWQFNDRVHAIDKTRLDELDYQIALAVQLLRELDGIIRRGLKSVKDRRARGETVDFQPARDVANFYSVGWQYGGGVLLSWMSAGASLSVDGFKRYRSSIGKPAHSSYDGRARSFRAHYSRIESDAPDAWRDVVVSTYTNPVQSAKDLGALAAENLPELPDPRDYIPDPGDWFDKLVKGAKGAFVFGAIMAGFFGAALLIGLYLFFKFKDKTAGGP